MIRKTAIIIGSNGQDGRILFDFLSKKKYNLIGISKGGVEVRGLRWSGKVNINKSKEVFDLIKTIKPDEVYHLAAYHHSSQDKVEDDLVLLNKSYQTNFFSLVNFLEAIRRYSPNSRLFYASSSMVFGSMKGGRQNEVTPFNPDSFYALSKLDGLLLCRLYRGKYGLFASAGILFNHESAYRQKKFVFRKIIQGAIDIKNKKQKVLKVGNLQAEVDWGYAPDYMEAAYKILKASASDDFIVATGEKHSVLDLVRVAFGYFGLDYKKYVVEDKNIICRKKIAALGNAGKLSRITGWKPRVGFEEMVIKIIKQLDV